jgi:hypothetical protein
MTDLRQAAQQALEALENSSPDQYPEDAGVFYDAITALRTALEQQAEPVAWMDREGDLYKMPEIKNWAPPHTMLYTTSPQRQWVGLTDEDVNRESAMIASQMKLAFHAGLYVAQKILKEKNGG